MPDAETLFQKIQALPPERIAEVEDFVTFIIAREQERALSRAGGGGQRAGFCGDLEQSGG